MSMSRVPTEQAEINEQVSAADDFSHSADDSEYFISVSYFHCTIVQRERKKEKRKKCLSC
jgi:hypothetical protein